MCNLLHYPAAMERAQSMSSYVFDVFNCEAHASNLEDVELIFSTWGMLRLPAEQLDLLPHLRRFLYSGQKVSRNFFGLGYRYSEKLMETLRAIFCTSGGWPESKTRVKMK